MYNDHFNGFDVANQIGDSAKGTYVGKFMYFYVVKPKKKHIFSKGCIKFYLRRSRATFINICLSICITLNSRKPIRYLVGKFIYFKNILSTVKILLKMFLFNSNVLYVKLRYALIMVTK